MTQHTDCIFSGMLVTDVGQHDVAAQKNNIDTCTAVRTLRRIRVKLRVLR
jgi:hypothetical protein